MYMLLLLLFITSQATRLCMTPPTNQFPSCDNPVKYQLQCLQVSSNIDCSPVIRVRQVQGSLYKKVTCSKLLSTYNCTRCETGEARNSCNGDQLYCAEFRCKPNPKCHCTIQKYSTVTEANYRGVWYQPQALNITFAFDDTPPVFTQGNLNPFGVNRIQPSRSIRSVSSISYDNTRITVVTPQPDFTRVLASKDGLNEFFTCANVDCLVQLPDTYFINPGVLYVKVYLNDTIDKEATFTLNSYSRCKVPGCIFCVDLYNDFMCFPLEFKAFFISTIVAMCLASVLILIFMTRIFWVCCTKVGCCMRCRSRTKDLVNVTFNKMTRKNVVKKAQFDPMDDNEGVFLEDPTPMRLIPEGSLKTVMLIIVLALPLVLGASCTQGITIPTSVSTCYADGTDETCFVEFETLISIPSPSLSSCLTFKTPDDNPIGTFTVTYTQSLDIAPLQSEYFTTSWVGVSYSVKQCPWSHMCGSCASYDPISDPTAGGLIIGLPTFYTGVSRCDSQCGCAGCGCFACDASCVYSRAALVVPAVDIGQVMRPISVRHQPQLVVNFTTSSGSEVTVVDVTGFDMQVGQNFSLTIQGSLTGSTTVFGDQRVVVTSSSVTMGAASAPNAPVRGSVGDVQANSPGEFSPFTPFKYAAGLWTALPTSTQTNYLFEGPGWSARSSHDTLPTVRGTTLWTYSDGNLVGLNSNPGSVIATIRTNRPVQVSRKVNIVCPEIYNATLDGCYSCDQGATITIIAKSRCSEGAALVTIDGTFTVGDTSVTLTTVPSTIMIRVTSSSKNNQGTLRLSSGNYHSEILVTGVLVYEDIIVNQNQTLSNTTGGTTPSFVDFQSWFNNLAEWARGLLVTGMVIAAIAAAIVVAVIIYKVVASIKRARVEARYDKLQDDERARVVREMELNAFMKMK